MKRSLWATSAAVVMAITLVAPISAAGRLTVSACATSSGALQTTVAWSGIPVTSYGIGILDPAGVQISGAGVGELAKPLRHFRWIVSADIAASEVGSVIGGVWDAKAGAPMELTVAAPWSACN